MTRLPKRAALALSILAILASWVWQLTRAGTAGDIPQHFSELVLRIVRNKLLVFAALMLLLHLEGEGLAALGLTADRWRRRIALGIGLGTAMFVALNAGLSSVMQSLIPPTPGAPSIMRFFRDPANLLMWIPIGVVAGGVVEELQRIFVITRFEKALGPTGLALGVILSSAMFGVGHLYQGLGNAISTAVSGLILALIYVRRRSAVEPIVAHAWSDVLAVIAATLLAGRQ